jgi:hypothetical protein
MTVLVPWSLNNGKVRGFGHESAKLGETSEVHCNTWNITIVGVSRYIVAHV